MFVTSSWLHKASPGNVHFGYSSNSISHHLDISICLAVTLTTNDLSIGSTQQNSNPPINTATPKNIPNLANHAPHAPKFGFKFKP